MFVTHRYLANDKTMTSLDCLNVNASDNGCLSFLDSILPGGAANESIFKDQHSLFGDNAFTDAIDGDGPSPFLGQDPMLGFNDLNGANAGD